MDIRELEIMPFDRVFETENGRENCHATGYEVFIAGIWWNEYVDSQGNYHYGN